MPDRSDGTNNNHLPRVGKVGRRINQSAEWEFCRVAVRAAARARDCVVPLAFSFSFPRFALARISQTGVVHLYFRRIKEKLSCENEVH